jgi:hypothetical protein
MNATSVPFNAARAAYSVFGKENPDPSKLQLDPDHR